MTTAILKHIISAKKKGKKLIALLLDPDKTKLSDLDEICEKIKNQAIHLIFIGGSTVQNNVTHLFVESFKKKCALPILIFPGNHNQITNEADAILFLSLLSGDNPEYLIHQQIAAAPILKNTQLEIIPTAYILIDGGNETAVQRVSKTKPISQSDPTKIVHTALAGQYMGKQLIYLEAGSGAKTAIQASIISKVAKEVSVPLIVGGGLRTKEAIQTAFKHGADMVVIGTVFEENQDFLNQL
ncbi:geranylgeranylglyceryl/heptaprenylglyceryl phosphate synthase [Flavicella sediminum]|uniref:geranylgeranylglyceryl/heptaprenylglyceryl phosphate synthase n=1 Tax=Flavicella sediminum TaxID=2585141 RepID=UPI00112332D8|nr:geranylgeranylglyceryl/heptaprenylglyceryl phosphate synthase [Flavicella sediminum]